MNKKETNEIRELTAAEVSERNRELTADEIDAVHGGAFMSLPPDRQRSLARDTVKVA
jgi:hypothetical protein